MSPTSKVPPKTAKKYVRSSSPRAVDRRRLQNRIAQRNHRQRIRQSVQVVSSTSSDGRKQEDKHQIEQQEDAGIPQQSDLNTVKQSNQDTEEKEVVSSDQLETKTTSTTPSCQESKGTNLEDLSNIDPRLHPKVPLQSTPLGFMDENSMVEDQQNKQQGLHWLSMEQMAAINMPVPNYESPMSYSNGPSFMMQPTCACNGVTGPCAIHLERMRLDVMTAEAPLHSAQQQKRHQVPSGDLPAYSMSTPARLSQFATSKSIDMSQQHQPMGSSQNSPSSHARRFTPNPLESRSLPEDDGHSTSVSHAMQPTPPPSVTTKQTTSIPTKYTTNATARFGNLLEVVQAAGFADFDRMAIAYYTAHFDRGSLPDLAQRASRGRRLKTVLQALQDSSDQWPRWESRGLQEGVIESTKALCISEIEDVNVDQTFDHHHIEAVDIISAFGSIFNSDQNATVMPRSNDETGGDQDNKRKATPRLSDAALSECIEGIQDSVPHLWSLLTELAGPHGIYCDKIAQVILATLIYPFDSASNKQCLASGLID